MLVVGVGASAGGFEALKLMLRDVPPDSGLAFLVMFHADSGGADNLLKALPRPPGLELEKAVDGRTLEAGHLYVVPSRRDIRIEDGVLRVGPLDEDVGANQAPIDRLLQALATDQKTQAVAVILSGLGSDGALGLKAVSDGGGMTIVQDPGSARNEGMPQSALDTGSVDFVLEPSRILPEILGYAERKGGRDDDKRLREELSGALPEICDTLLGETGHDFRHYKTSTLLRRTLRRLHVLRLDSAQAYVRRLRSDRSESRRLFQDLLVSVTAFFRDAEAFDVLAQQAIQPMLAGKSSQDSLRIWVPGCATGQEAYTVAMIVQEYLDLIQDPPAVQIFATDIDERALAVARQGVYPIGIEDSLSPERLARFFVKSGERYRVTQDLRALCLFSAHNLINDPPFSQLDLISCRNLLIYLGSHLQKKLIPVFHFALKPGGYLLLGPSENVSEHRELFRPVDVKHRLSQRLPTAIRPADLVVERRATIRQSNAAPIAQDDDIYMLMQRIILDEFAGKGVVVDAEGKILCAEGNLEKYLTVSSGAFHNNVVRLARNGLSVVLRATLAEAAKTKRRAVREGAVHVGNVRQRVQMTVQPMPQLGEDGSLFLVVFHDVPDNPYAPTTGAGGSEDQVSVIIEQLEQELAATRADLMRTVQDLESANEELKSSNEELLSMNEELQSANEELQTSREEIQTANQSLARANDDLENLLASTQIATIFLDAEGQLRRLTEAASVIYNVRPSDMGRSLSDYTHHAKAMPPLPDQAAFDESQHVIEDEVEMLDGRVFLRRVTPYKTADGTGRGLVVAFIDISDRRHTEDRLRASESLYRAIGESINYGVWVCDRNGRNTYASESFLRLVGLTQEECSDYGWGGVLHPDDLERTVAAWKECVATGGAWDVEHRFRGVDGRWHPILARGLPVRDADGNILCWAGINLDISRQKRTEDELRASERRFRLVADAAPVLIWMSGVDGRHTWFNRRWLEFTGRTMEQEAGAGWAEGIHPDDRQIALDSYVSSFERREPFTLQYRLRRYDGEYRWILDRGVPLRAGNGRFMGFIGSCADNHDQRIAEQTLIEADHRKDEFLAMLGHELRNPLAAIVNANLVASKGVGGEKAQRWAAEVIERQSRQLTRLVDDLLDLSRITSGSIHLEREPLDVQSVLEIGLESTRNELEQKGHELTVEWSKQPLVVNADAARLEQVFVNVVSNAIKYTEPGGRISVSAKARDGCAVVRVADSGKGISGEMLPQIFDAFIQGDAPHDDADGGLGLGLAVVKLLMEKHGGYVRAESPGVGQGAEFVLGIPLCEGVELPGAPAARADEAAAATPRRVLLVEDHADNAETLSMLLERAGHEVTVVASGHDALAVAPELRPEVVLLDLGLPGLDGYAVAEALRKSENGDDALIAAISGYGQERDKERSRAAGIDLHFVKPVDLPTLLAAIDKKGSAASSA